MLNQDQINYIIDVAYDAGEIAKRYFYDKNFDVTLKSDNSKVTSADLEISKFIKKSLEKKFQNKAIICEEGELRNNDLDLFFLIDPIDGTSSFAKGSEEFCINIALIKNNKVVFGLIYAPIFAGQKMLYSDANSQVILKTNNDEKIINKIHSLNNNIVITSKRTKDEELVKYMNKYFNNNYDILKVSSAVKFFYLLESKANIYLHFSKSMEWDIAPGQYFVELLGGQVKKLDVGTEISEIKGDFLYNKLNYENGPFVMRF